VVGGLLAALALYRLVVRPPVGPLSVGLAAAAAALLAPAIVAPGLLTRPHALWMRMAAALGWFNTRLLLGAVFFGMMVPVGLAARWLVRRDLLAAKACPELSSYWTERVGDARRPTTSQRMF